MVKELYWNYLFKRT